MKGRLAQGVDACRVAVAAKAFESQLSSPNAVGEAIPEHGQVGATEHLALHLSTIEAVGPPSTSAPGLNPKAITGALTFRECPGDTRRLGRPGLRPP